MKVSSKLLVPALLAGLFLSACGEKPTETPVAVPAEVATPTAEVAVPVEEASGAGGYVPTAEELIPGATVPQAELDIKNAEALANTPKPIIPGEAPVAPAAAAPAEVAPAPEAPSEVPAAK